MKITRKQIRKIIKETWENERWNRSGANWDESAHIQALVKKHASGGKSINAATAAALQEDPDVDPKVLEDAMEDYYDEMMGY